MGSSSFSHHNSFNFLPHTHTWTLLLFIFCFISWNYTITDLFTQPCLTIFDHMQYENRVYLQVQKYDLTLLCLSFLHHMSAQLQNLHHCTWFIAYVTYVTSGCGNKWNGEYVEIYIQDAGRDNSSYKCGRHFLSTYSTVWLCLKPAIKGEHSVHQMQFGFFMCPRWKRKIMTNWTENHVKLASLIKWEQIHFIYDKI